MSRSGGRSSTSPDLEDDGSPRGPSGDGVGRHGAATDRWRRRAGSPPRCSARQTATMRRRRRRGGADPTSTVDPVAGGTEMPFVRPSDMVAADPLPGWSGRFLHSAHDVRPLRHRGRRCAAARAPARAGRGVAHRRGPGGAHHRRRGAGARRRLHRRVPPHTPHSVRPLSASRAIIADYPLRPNLPGM